MLVISSYCEASAWVADHCRALYQETMMTPMKAPPVVVTSSDHSHWRAWWRRSFQMSAAMGSVFFPICASSWDERPVSRR